MNQKKYDRALKEMLEGKDAHSVVQELIALEEAKSGRPQTPQGHALQKFASTALSAAALWKLMQSAFQTSDQGLMGRGINAFIGSTLMKTNALLASKISGAAVNAMGGPQAFSGHGATVRHSLSLNVPSPDMVVTKQGTGRFQRETIRMPMSANGGFGGEQVNLARIEADPNSDGYAINLYSNNPETGFGLGAPVKTFNMTFSGMQPKSLQKMEQSIAQTISQMGEALVHNRPVYHPPIIVQRSPGRPHLREY